MTPTDYTRTLEAGGRQVAYIDIRQLEKEGRADIGRLPFTIRVLVENLLRKLDGRVVTEADLLNIAGWQRQYAAPVEIPYHPARVLMQDFTGVPAIVDLAVMRDAVHALGGNPARINPLVPVDLVVDHSVQVDHFGTPDALQKNVAKEYERNAERYALLKWAQKSFDNLRVVPPNSGICHQVNLEYLGQVVRTETRGGRTLAFPDTVVGTDSHTPMIAGIGVLGWGVGGIEAEAVMLGQPYYMSIPQVVGVHLTGALRPGVTATDLVLTLTETLRRHKVVEKFVEYFGPGMQRLTVPERACIANMTPENGSTVGFFPVDQKTLDYLRQTDRQAEADLVEACARAQGLFYTGDEQPEYSAVVEFDLGGVEPCVAGPARPQDRIVLPALKKTFRDETIAARERKSVELQIDGRTLQVGDGSVVVAAITSCTNTSNPRLLVGAGLLARNAAARGLAVPPHVKTSFAPGSRVVARYLEDAGLMPDFEALGFHLAAFGCTTCIGNSGPLAPAIEKAIEDHGLTVASVLSGNRNFEARIHQRIRANYLASPMLVVAFALAGRIDRDLSSEPLGVDAAGSPVFLTDIWPDPEQVETLIRKHVKNDFYAEEYGRIFEGDDFWSGLGADRSTTFAWDDASTYIKKPPYFDAFTLQADPPGDIEGAHALLALGDTVTTDHISPAGAIPAAYPAGRYLVSKGVAPPDFNSYGSRRGNHEVMMRGTFGNIRVKNRLVAPKEGSWTVKLPENQEMHVFEAAVAYLRSGTPLVVLGGKEYGTGSSRDWAAKGTTLLGIRAVMAESFERIHRNNLVGMGVLPLVFAPGETIDTLGLTGRERFALSGIRTLRPRSKVQVTAAREDGTQIAFEMIARLDTEIEVDYFKNGGILPYVLRQMLA